MLHLENEYPQLPFQPFGFINLKFVVVVGWCGGHNIISQTAWMIFENDLGALVKKGGTDRLTYSKHLLIHKYSDYRKRF